MNFIEIKLPRHVVYLTPEEIGTLLKSDLSLYKEAIGRGKGISRNRAQKQRERAKMDE